MAKCIYTDFLKKLVIFGRGLVKPAAAHLVPRVNLPPVPLSETVLCADEGTGSPALELVDADDTAGETTKVEAS